MLSGMNDELEATKSPKIIRVLNIVMLIFNFLMAFGVIAIKFARATYVEISNQIFSPEGPLMDSAILDLLLRKSMAVLVIVILVVLVIKEKKIKLVKHRLYINMAAFAAIAGYASLLIYLIYLPIFRAS